MASTQQSRRMRGALLLAMCLCSLWSFQTATSFTETEGVTTDASFGVKLVGEHPLIFTFLSMFLCGALCYTENSTTTKLDFDKRHWFSGFREDLMKIEWIKMKLCSKHLNLYFMLFHIYL